MMDGIFSPEGRSWVSRLVNLQELGDILHKLEDEHQLRVTEPGVGMDDEEPLQRTKEEQDAINELKKIIMDKTGSSSTGKNSGLPNSLDLDETSSEDVQLDFHNSLEEAGKFRKELDELEIDYDSDDDFECQLQKDREDGFNDDEEDKHTDNSEDEDNHRDSSDSDDNDPLDGDFNMNSGSDPNSQMQDLMFKLKAMRRNPVDFPHPLREAQDESDAKDDKEFALFLDYNEAKSRERAREAILREKPRMMRELPRMSDDEYMKMAKKACPILAADRHEVMVDDGVLQKVEMPLLAGPIPHSAIRKLTTLALYTSLSDEPGNFQWKSTHVMEQLTASQQLEKQHMRHCQRIVRPTKRDPNLLPYDSFIVTVSLFQPSEISTYDLKGAQDPKTGLQIEVLGHHTLKDLKELFFCQKNYTCTKEVEKLEKWVTMDEAMKRYKDHLSMNLHPEDAMYIHETCYTDGSETSKLHHKEICDWIKGAPNKEMNVFKHARADSTKICDLTLRFGYPYSYIHQGDCEHILVFNSIRLPRPIEYSVFPRHEVVGNYPLKFCRLDKEFLARWIVAGSDRFPEDPILLCNSCLEEYCFDGNKNVKKKKKRGEFRLYPFLQITAFL